MDYITNNLLDIITVLIAATALILTFIFYLREKKEFFKRKNLETFIELESNKDTFTGSLSAFNIKLSELDEDDLSIEQLMYYSGLLNTLWIRNYYSDKRIKKIDKTLDSKGFDIAFQKAKEYDNIKPILFPEGQTSRILKSNEFKKAWKYLEQYWSHKSLIRLIVVLTLEKNQNLNGIK
jgi:hypothetical protein